MNLNLNGMRRNWIGSGRQLLIKRHSKIILRHLTPKKIGNLSLNIFEFITRKSKLKSHPIYMKIEPTHFCHLKCPGCKHSSSKESQLKFEDFKKIIDPVKDTLIGISFSHLGEPLWCEDLPKMIEYASKNNIGTMFPTNLSIPISDERAERIVCSGLDLIMVSLDGVTKETNRKYRNGGSFNLILRNLKKLKDAKTKLGTANPEIQWKFITFDHNRHEVEYVKENYRRMGFDSYSIEEDKLNRNSEISQSKESYNKNRRKRKKACFWPWNFMIIAWDGDVQPCCWTYKDYIKGQRAYFGNAIFENSKSIWKGENYTTFRSGFVKNLQGTNLHEVCKLCMGLTNKHD